MILKNLMIISKILKRYDDYDDYKNYNYFFGLIIIVVGFNSV